MARRPSRLGIRRIDAAPAGTGSTDMNWSPGADYSVAVNEVRSKLTALAKATRPTFKEEGSSAKDGRCPPGPLCAAARQGDDQVFEKARVITGCPFEESSLT